MFNTAKLRVFLACLSILASSSLASVSASSFELVLAKVSTDAEKALEQLSPMAQHIADRLSEYGVTGGRVKLYNTVEDLAEAIVSGEVHWVTDTGFNAATLMRTAQADPIALKWKKGKARYSSLIFARNDSEVQALADLVGGVIAFEDEGSFTSYFLPRLLIENEGLSLHRMASLHDQREPMSVNYVFGRTEKNIALWVEKGLVDAGALSSDDWNAADRLLPGSKSKVRQVLVSDPYPRAYELAAPSLPGNIKSALTATLLEMNMTEHSELLTAYEKTSRFESISQGQLEQLRTFAEVSATW